MSNNDQKTSRELNLKEEIQIIEDIGVDDFLGHIDNMAGEYFPSSNTDDYTNKHDTWYVYLTIKKIIKKVYEESTE